ncbi:OstA-like protein [Flavobacterium sp.]|uniref:OstA-like protein n=1 Tax=Flavobacterium sp. TaxID=239 RepID=UPI00121BB473|nr:OstA-like protein [Flavobacterium sp.]RZJ69603.1 MAG: OstA-like protein [Flavobacterium sp.]
MKKLLFFTLLALFASFSGVAQKNDKINIEHADNVDKNEYEMPGALLLQGNVRVNHDGAIMTCNKAYLFPDGKYMKAFGDVRLVQGDTLFLDSRYAEYSATTKQALATGNVVLRSPDMTLTTDTIYFDRNVQEAYYRTPGTITNKDNVLKSNTGRYYASQKKFVFLTAVTLTNPKYVMKSNHLDYFDNSGHAYLFGPSTITSEQNYIYTEKGFYDSKKNVGHFLNHSYINYKDRKIEGDSLFYDRKIEFASATRNVKITDTINKGIVKGHYGEVWKLKDSLFVTKRAVAINLVEKDSVYIHGKRLLVTGKPENRVIRAWPNARFYKSDMSGKCDSIHSSQVTGLTKMINKPVLWNFENQLTGDIMHLIADKKTEKLDSLKVLGHSFIIAKDSAGTGYNQVKGVNLYGKFRENKLYEVDIVKNTECIYYVRNDAQELVGINKSAGSRINLLLTDNKIDVLTVYDSPAGDLTPEKDFPENARKLRDFVWRGDERIKTKDDIFPPEENAYADEAKKETDAEAKIDDKPMEIRKETLDYGKPVDTKKKAPAKKQSVKSQPKPSAKAGTLPATPSAKAKPATAVKEVKVN